MVTIPFPGRTRPVFLSLAGLLSLAVSPIPPAPAPALRRPRAAVERGYQYSVVGNPRDVVTETRPGLVLEGGGTDVDQAFAWMIDRSGGGDFVVIRVAGTDAYNADIFNLAAPGGLRPDSVATLVIPSRDVASDPFVIETIRNAEALWIAGGDQSLYVTFWRGTPVEEAIQAVIAKGAPVGGTSAGMVIMGQFLYSAERDQDPCDELTSKPTLEDPFNHRVTLVRDFLDVPNLSGVILDSHFVEQDRMGRLASFLGRIAQEGWSGEIKGIGIDRETALLVEPNGQATMVARPTYPRPAAYFLRMTGRPDVCAPGTPLVARNIQVQRITPAGAFDLRAWTASEGTRYTLAVENSRLTSSLPNGEIYQ